MEKIIRVKCDGEVFDLLGVFVVVRRSGLNDDTRIYELRGVYQDDQGVVHCPLVMTDFDSDFLLDAAEFLGDKRAEACPSLLPIDCSVGSDIYDLVWDYMAKRSQLDLEES